MNSKLCKEKVFDKIIPTYHIYLPTFWWVPGIYGTLAVPLKYTPPIYWLATLYGVAIGLF